MDTDSGTRKALERAKVRGETRSKASLFVILGGLLVGGGVFLVYLRIDAHERSVRKAAQAAQDHRDTLHADERAFLQLVAECSPEAAKELRETGTVSEATLRRVRPEAQGQVRQWVAGYRSEIAKEARYHPPEPSSLSYVLLHGIGPAGFLTIFLGLLALGYGVALASRSEPGWEQV